MSTDTLPFDAPDPTPAPTPRERARIDADLGMARATSHAESVHGSEWSAAALVFLCAYARHHASFVGHEVVQASRDTNAVPDASGKAWGSIFTKAARLGWIRKSGEFEADVHRHMNPAPIWTSLIHTPQGA